MRDVGTGGLLHGHRLLEQVGAGRYGEVWRAEHQGRPVALKVFTGGRPAAHLRQETLAQVALGRLPGEDGRWFPRIDHVDLDADPPYLRMEFVDGTPLEGLLSTPALPLDQRLALGEAVLSALAVVHREGFVHGDLSPSNVLVTPDRSVRLIDVGYGAPDPGEPGDLAVSTTREDRPTGVASPLYAAPERFRSDGCRPASDVFSFGRLLYRVITGEQPFVIKPVSRKFPELGKAWDDFIFRCLEERADDRFADAGMALAELHRLWRPQGAAGAYRAECPECRAAQPVPGGWAGGRFGCRACGRALEVLFYDDASRYATTAIVGDGMPAPPIHFLDAEDDARARKSCPACGGEIRPEAKQCRHCWVWVDDVARRVVEETRREQRARGARPSFIVAALLTCFGYLLFWVPGAVLNAFFLGEARRVERQTGRRPPGMLALELLAFALIAVPAVLVGGCLAIFLFFVLLVKVVV
jgi:hypothetical protein